MHSDSINELAGALAKAQGQMRAASKDAKNPHLGNTYATLSSIIEASKEPLSANGLAFSQILSQGDGGLVLETLLMHSSGQWLQSEVLVTAQAGNRGVNEVQQLGSSLTYYKRYALTAILGISISDEDDDGNGATPPARQERRQQEQRPAPKVETPKTTTTAEAESKTKGSTPTNGKELLALVNDRVLVTYDNEEALLKAIRSKLGSTWDWPKADNRDGWAKAFAAAKEVAESKTTEKNGAAGK